MAGGGRGEGGRPVRPDVPLLDDLLAWRPARLHFRPRARITLNLAAGKRVSVRHARLVDRAAHGADAIPVDVPIVSAKVVVVGLEKHFVDVRRAYGRRRRAVVLVI